MQSNGLPVSDLLQQGLKRTSHPEMGSHMVNGFVSLGLGYIILSTNVIRHQADKSILTRSMFVKTLYCVY